MDAYTEVITPEGILKDFKLQTLTSKADVLFFTHNLLDDIKKKAKNDKIRTAAYYSIIYKMIDEFIEQVNSIELIEDIDGPWCYEVGFDEEAIRLYINYNELRGYMEKAVMYNKLSFFTLLEIKSKMLTVEEYANIYGVGVGTVRQWIRRGKLRTAIKEGNEWRIPELTDKPNRGYQHCWYEWNYIDNLSSEYKYLNKYSGVLIEQDEDDKKIYYAYFCGKPDKELGLSEFEYEKKLDKKDVEKLELFLISNKDVRYKHSINSVLNEILTERQETGDYDERDKEVIAWLNRNKG